MVVKKHPAHFLFKSKIMKIVLIAVITGQDGTHLTELFLKKGYEVHEIKRRSSIFSNDCIDDLCLDPHE